MPTNHLKLIHHFGKIIILIKSSLTDLSHKLLEHQLDQLQSNNQSQQRNRVNDHTPPDKQSL